MELENKVALVTGTPGGIGSAIALALAKAKCAVVMNYLGDAFKRDAESLVGRIKTEQGKAIAVDADITKRDDVSKLVEKSLREFGRIDFYVNSAGIHHEASILDLDERAWDAMVSGPQLKGAFLCCKAVAPIMLKNKLGKIVLIAGSTAFIGSADYPHYAATVAGVVALVKSLARSLAPFVNVNGIAPAHIETGMLAKYSAEKRRQLQDSIPLKRFGKPEEIAQGALFLLTNDYVTGHTLLMTGGWVM